MRIHSLRLLSCQFSSGGPRDGRTEGRSRSGLNYMRSPAVNHTSPRQPAFTPSPRQHQCGPIPSTHTHTHTHTHGRQDSTEKHCKFISSFFLPPVCLCVICLLRVLRVRRACTAAAFSIYTRAVSSHGEVFSFFFFLSSFFCTGNSSIRFN